jgi:hypothetical protein
MDAALARPSDEITMVLSMRNLWLVVALGGCTSSARHAAPDLGAAVDWALTFDASSAAGTLAPTLLGHYDLSGALFGYDKLAALPPLMKTAGFGEWRVGVGRWEFATQLLPQLTDGSSCASAITLPMMAAPAGTTDLDLIRARDWFTYTDGAPVTMAMIADDGRYQLDYVRSVIDVATRMGATAYVDIDHLPRALAVNQTPLRSNAEWPSACGITWTNKVSNVRPADPSVFAAAVAGMVRRVVEGSAGQPGRPVRYWEFWNEPELAYAWNPSVGDFMSWLSTAAMTLTALDSYRKQTANPDGRVLRIGLGSFAYPEVAAMLLPQFPAPFDFVSFHGYDDDPLVIASKIQAVADARAASSHPNVELVLAEWGVNLQTTTLDPASMDMALHHATVLALGATSGLTHAHHAIFWDFFAVPDSSLAVVHHDFSPKPAYYAFVLLAKLIGSGATRLPAIGFADGKLDGGMGAVIAGKDAAGTVRVLLVNRNRTARSATVGALPTAVTVFDDPAQPPRSVAPSEVVTVPARSIVLVER